MREFLLIFALSQGSYWAGWTVRARLYRAKPAHVSILPEQLTPEFKAWLLDYIRVNAR